MKNIKLALSVALAFLSFSLVGFPSFAQQEIRRLTVQPDWIRDFPAFRIAGNLYYVGSYDLASYLIATPEGHILINTGVAGSDTMIRKHVEDLGFKWSDIKILLTSQAHFDHVGAMAAVKRETGARLMVEEGDAPVLEDGGNSDYYFGGKGPVFEHVHPDGLLHDRDSIRLGGMAILVLHHPGHTKGATSFLFMVKDEKRSYRVLIANIPTILPDTKFPSMPGYPQIGNDFVYTLGEMPKLSFDLWFAAHASQFNLHDKYKPGDGYRPEAFIDRAGYDAAIHEQQLEYIRDVK